MASVKTLKGKGHFIKFSVLGKGGEKHRVSFVTLHVKFYPSLVDVISFNFTCATWPCEGKLSQEGSLLSMKIKSFSKITQIDNQRNVTLMWLIRFK